MKNIKKTGTICKIGKLSLGFKERGTIPKMLFPTKSVKLIFKMVQRKDSNNYLSWM